LETDKQFFQNRRIDVKGKAGIFDVFCFLGGFWVLIRELSRLSGFAA
jgi:hypothetical protein